MDHKLAATARWLGCVLLCAAPALAASAGEHGEAETPNLFSGDLGNSIWTLVIFVVLLIVLGRFAWGPILATLQRREQFIRESLEQAKRDRDEASRRLQEQEQALRKAHEEAVGIVEEARRDAEALRARVAVQSREEAAAMIARARREIGIARDTAVKDLYQLIADMSSEVAATLLRRHLTDEEHRRLIEASLNEIRSRIEAGGGSN